MKIKYKENNFRQQSLVLINKVNAIIDEYKSGGYELTLRQIYYQLVARNIIPNSEESYKKIGNLLNRGRLAGLIDWNSIIDRTRNLQSCSHWNSSSEIINAVSKQFAYDKWERQKNYIEVWVEKDALIGVVGKACKKLDVSYFSCRGYVSQSEMWRAAERIRLKNKHTIIIHLGDHDASGIDMSRDIFDRLTIFSVNIEFKRIAINLDQIRKYNPPPNPTKITDTRYSSYIKKYGNECWELDALEPSIIENLINVEILKYCDQDLFKKIEQKEIQAKKLLSKVSDNWSEIEKDYS